MAQQVVTELVIDANTAGADQFSESMGKAGSAAATTVLQVAGVGVAVAGMLVGLRSFIDYVGNTNKQLIDLNDNAKLAGMSTREFQQTLFAARTAGLTEKDFVSGLDKIGQDLTQASRGVTDFGKLFEANGLSIKDTNGKLKDTKTALNDIAGLMQNATPQVQQGIARIVGLSKDWVPLLREGADAIDLQKQVAEGLGVIIDDDIIQKAKDFDREWRLAIATWDTQFKASLVEILPMMVKLAGYAITIVEGIGKVSGFFMHTMTPVDEMGGADLTKRLDELKAVRDLMKEVGPEIDKGTQFQMGLKRGAAGLPEDAGLNTVDAEISRVEELLKKKKELEGLPRVTVNGSGTVLPAFGGDQNDAVDRAINSLQRHTLQQEADAKAVGMGAGALAQFRAEAALTAAVQANGGRITAQQAADFETLKQRAIAAAEAMAKARVAADIKFGRDTGFLSQEDVQIAQQLKAIYPDVATALASVEAQGIRVNNAMREFSSSLEQNLTSGLTDIATGAKTASQGFADMALSIVKSLDQMLIKMLVVEPIMRGLQSLLGGFGGGGALPLPGQANFIGPVVNAHGNAFDAGNIIPFARGGVVDSPTLAPMALFGEAGPEAIVPLRRGADGNLGIASSGGGGGGSVSIGDIYVTVPEGTSPQNAAAIGQAVKASIEQVVDARLSYHTRSRGMLNRAA